LPGGFLDHVHEHPAQGHGVAGPPGPRSAEGQLVDRCVGDRSRPATVGEQVHGRLVPAGAQIRVRVGRVERDLVGRSPEGAVEPPLLHRRQVLDQPGDLPHHHVALQVQALVQQPPGVGAGPIALSRTGHDCPTSDNALGSLPVVRPTTSATSRPTGSVG